MKERTKGQSTAYQVFWGDTHHNSYTGEVQDPPLSEILEFASTHLDFYSGAYYTPVSFPVRPRDAVQNHPVTSASGHPQETAGDAGQVTWRGPRIEGTKTPERLGKEWAEFQETTAAWNRPEQFIAFPGYEWQGDGRWGDLNVTYRTEGAPVYTVPTLAELQERLRDHDAIAIPHHTGYLVGQRAPRWDLCDEQLSPYAEIFSIHGSSETDEEWIGLRNNSHMGPGTAGGTYQDALDRGLHLGAIGSTDNWSNMPGHWGQGLMACLATELTREALWDAFRARRVYAVSGDRLHLEFTCNGACMGRVLDHAPVRDIQIAVRGSDAIDRIELLRNGRVIATHCHQGTWRMPSGSSRFKLRIEAGWGPRPGELPLDSQAWEGALTVDGGSIVGWEPCWLTRGQSVPVIDGNRAGFAMVSRQSYVTRGPQGAVILEFEARPETPLHVRMNELEISGAVQTFAAGSRLLWSRAGSERLLIETTGLTPADTERPDVFYHVAGKVKVHRAMPEAAYTASLSICDDEPLERETHYRVRVEQRNGQRAWSSPIWVRPADA